MRSLPKPNLRILSSSRYKDPLFLEMSCSSWPPDTQRSQESKHKRCTINADILRCPPPSTSFLSELLYSAARERVSEETWERALHDGYWARECVHSPDVCPCRECVCMCVCRVRSIVLSIWNMPRSSSSRAMSPQNTAAGGGEVHTVSSRVSNTTQHLMPSVVWILWMGSPLLPQNNTTGNNLKSLGTSYTIQAKYGHLKRDKMTWICHSVKHNKMVKKFESPPGQTASNVRFAFQYYSLNQVLCCWADCCSPLWLEVKEQYLTWLHADTPHGVHTDHSFTQSWYIPGSDTRK